MKMASFPQVTRVTLVGKNGLAYEDYNLMKGGAEVHLQDNGRTLKVLPWDGQPDPQPERKGMDPAWKWPVRVLVLLLFVVLMGTLFVVLTACAAGGTTDSSWLTGDDGTVKSSESTSGFTQHTFNLDDGRTVTCITWSEWDLINDAYKSGMDCLEPKAQ